MQPNDIADDTQEAASQAEAPNGPEKGGESPIPDQSIEWAVTEALEALGMRPHELSSILSAGEEPADEEPLATPAGAPEAITDNCGQDAGAPAPGTPKSTASVAAISGAKIAANRANALKSTGPRTEEGKRTSSMNALKSYSGRLYGAVQSRTLRLDPGGAERIYEELVRPYERPGRPVPAMLALHFHDFARLRLELEAWERIGDAEIEEQWRQNDIERRQRLHDLMKDLPGRGEELVMKGVMGQPDSPARSKKLVELLWMLQDELTAGHFNIGWLVEAIYGQDANVCSDNAQTIRMFTERLIRAKKKEALEDYEFKALLGSVAAESREALASYNLYLDHAVMPPSASMARLKQTREDRAMSLHGERLRQAIDRKQRVIVLVLRVLGLNKGEDEDDYEDDEGVERRRARRNPVKARDLAKKRKKKILKFCKTNPPSHSLQRKSSKTKPKNRLKTSERTA